MRGFKNNVSLGDSVIPTHAELTTILLLQLFMSNKDNIAHLPDE